MRYTTAGLCFCALLLLSVSALAQASASPSADSFSSEPYLLKSSSHITTMHADGTGTDVDTSEIVIHAPSMVQQFSVLSVSYASFSQRAEFVYVRVHHPDGTTQETPVSGAMDQPAAVTQQAPSYSDIRIKQLPVKSLRPGDTLEWQARIETVHPEVPNQFWGGQTYATGVVQLNDIAELHVPSGTHVTVWTNPALHTKPEEVDANGEHIYRWHHSDLHPTVGASAEAAKLAESKRLRTAEEELSEEKGGLTSIAWTTFPDWSAVGGWYRSLEADRIAPDAAIKAKVAELTAGKASEFDKAQAVYTYVSTQIRYVGVSFGIGRYQPHTAAEVFANQYGDCKDKHTLLASMLSVLGLQADAALVGAGVRFNPDVPAPAAFNHVITHVQVNGKETWLDATSEIGRWGALLNLLRDREALVVPLTGAATIARTPAELPYPQSSDMTVTGTLDASLTSDSKIVLTLHDDTELYLRAVLHSVSPAAYGEFVQRLMAGMGFGGTTSEAEIDKLDDPSQPLVISFHYHRVPEKDWGEKRITATFAPIELPGFSPDTPPVSSIRLGPPRTETSTVELKLPDGWRMSPPDEVHAHTAFATCDVSYSVKDGKLFAQRKLAVLQKKIPLASYKQYQSWYDDAGVSGVPYLQLIAKPKSGTTAIAASPSAPSTDAAVPATPSDEKAASLVQKALTSVRAMDLDSARTSLDAARAINPTEPYLWSGYAFVAYALGKKTEVETNLRTELRYHPDESPAYGQLAAMQLQYGESDAAIDTMRSWEKVDPDNPYPPSMLATHLSHKNRNPEALKEAQDALTRLAGSTADLNQLRITAANIQVALGDSKKAAESVAPLLASVTDQVQTNDIAYVLAEGGLHLHEAEAAETRVIDQLESESSGWSVNGNLAALLREQAGIAADWDTMGWILHAEGKDQEALGYIEAALHTVDNKDVRDHRAALLAALHRPVAERQDLDLRNYPLGPAGARHGVASFKLLIADGKVVDSTPEHETSNSTPTLTNAKELLKSADLRALFPPNSKAHLLRQGFVNCVGDKCQLVLSPVQ